MNKKCDAAQLPYKKMKMRMSVNKKNVTIMKVQFKMPNKYCCCLILILLCWTNAYRAF